MSRSGLRDLSSDQFCDTRKNIALQDLQLIVQILAKALDFGLFDLKCAFIFLYAVTGENLHINDSPFDTAWHA